MSSIGTGYDLAASTFSPDGRIFQVEYANKAIDTAGTGVALRCKDGVVIAVEKVIATGLYLPTSTRRITNVDHHIGFGATGLYPDARALAQFCVEEAQDYYAEYREKIPCKHLADRLSLYVHAHTLYGALRPFGVGVFLASWNKHDGPQLFMVEPSGLAYGYQGWSVGKGRQAAKTEIEKLKLADMSCRTALKEATRIIYAVRDETKDKNVVLELSWVGEHTNGRHEIVPADVAEEAETFAKKALEDDDEETGTASG